MKKLLLFLSFLLFTHINSVKADDWNCMSKDQAESLVEYLSENPFVINFGDCCYDITGEDEEKPMGHLIKIENMDIVPCSYDDTQFSVRITRSTILMSTYIIGSSFSTANTMAADKEKYANPWTISLNYCFTLYDFKIPFRLYEIIEYEAEKINCSGLIDFPPPNILPEYPYKKDYTKFYESK